jgi:hypothetical protein
VEHCDHNAQHSIPDFKSAAVQKRLGPSALRIFRKMIEIWTITNEDALLLLGSQDEQILRCNPENVQLDRDTLMGISYLTGIFKALNTLHSQRLADQWISLPSANVIFGGQSPLHFMIDGGLPAMQIVRRLLDARCAGN